MAIQGMPVRDLISAAETRLGDAERNLATCLDSLNSHKRQHGGVPNLEVVSLSQAQAAVAQAYASVALAKSCVAMAEATEALHDDTARGEVQA
ncbi:hypothetical protein [Actinoplanes siamensis]|uniref:Uncharacterized protein n=1 Tax=Actinoplanes siamensis TaxID=1223317 RepID=A0A919NDD2_9ACTN|nr:hypothetical protein [Actinoplanes siamensis]GIF08654.1 hypothetical protein Asi03nite_61920 [Actinoplanes siamensis]